jgi:hypothetical protein
MTTMQIVIIVVAVIVGIALAALGTLWWRDRSLRTRFGPEYDRLKSERGRLAADRELHARERKHREVELRSLDPSTRERYAAAWRTIQAQFVDEPDQALEAADELLTRLVADRGYPTGDHEQQLEHLSVDHARTLSRYRDAHEIYLRYQQGEATTEEMRQAFVRYRELFADLLGEEPVEPDRGERGQGKPDQSEPARGESDHSEPARGGSDQAEPGRGKRGRGGVRNRGVRNQGEPDLGEPEQGGKAARR